MTRKKIALCFTCFALLAAGCTINDAVPDFGELGEPSRGDLAWPKLQPTQPLIAATRQDSSRDQASVEALSARVARMRRRAAVLNQKGMDDATRARLLRLIRDRG